MLDGQKLIKDMYEVVSSGVSKVSKQREQQILDEHTEFYNSFVQTRLLTPREERHGLSLSMIGKSDRQIYYSYNKYPREAIDSPTLRKFLYGDLIELDIILLAKLAGYTVENEQLQVDLAGIKGHIDCTINGVLIDAKSTSPFGFTKFVNKMFIKSDYFGYISQISAYYQALKSETGVAAFLVSNKVTGELGYAEVTEDQMIDALARVEYLKTMVEQPDPPPKVTGCCAEVLEEKNGNKFLNSSGSYCPYKKECNKECNGGKGLRTFAYSKGPRFFTEVVKEPRVFEVFDNETTEC